MKEFIKKNKSLLLAIFIPLVSMIIIYVFNHIYPFGDKIVAVGDGYTQYPGLLSNFLNTIKGKESLFYSFKGLLGFNAFASMVYYTFNITNLLGLLFTNVITFYNFIVFMSFETFVLLTFL